MFVALTAGMVIGWSLRSAIDHGKSRRSPTPQIMRHKELDCPLVPGTPIGPDYFGHRDATTPVSCFQTSRSVETADKGSQGPTHYTRKNRNCKFKRLPDYAWG